MKAPQPLVSVITPSMNQGRFIAENIESVRNQRYRNIQHIIIDGGSNDETIEVLRRYDNLEWISEPDRGQSDAINKGFARAKGSVLAYLNSDDSYLAGAIDIVARVFQEHPNVDVVYGDCYMTDEVGRVLRERREIDFDPYILLYAFNFIPQPSTFFRRSIVEKVGGFDVTLRGSMDYEYFLRLWKAGARFHHVRSFLSCYRLHPESVTYRQPIHLAQEYLMIKKKYSGHDYPAWVFRGLNKIFRAKRQLLKIFQGQVPDFWSLDFEIRLRKMFRK